MSNVNKITNEPKRKHQSERQEKQIVAIRNTARNIAIIVAIIVAIIIAKKQCKIRSSKNKNQNNI